MIEAHFTNGITHSFRAPFSGVLDEDAITQSLATFPEAILELQRVWSEVGPARNSGLALAFNGNPFDDAIRDGAWRQELQRPMPIAGGPGSRGKPQAWMHDTKYIPEHFFKYIGCFGFCSRGKLFDRGFANG